MKNFLVWLLSFTLLTSGMIFPNNSYAEGDEPVVDESVFDIPAAEGDRAIEEMMAVVIPLCKDDKGNWKDEVIKLPLNDEDFNCSSLRKMEFDMLVEQDNPESEKRALLCATRDLDVQGRLEFARTLESLDALQLPLEEHFSCPGKKESMSDCLKGITCNAINMVLDQATLGVASWVAEQLTDQKGICPTTTQTNCFNELIYGVVKNVVSNIEGIISLGKIVVDGVVSGAKKGYNAVKNWIWGVEEPSRDQHHVLQEETDQGILDWIADAGKKVKEMVTGFFSAMGTMIDQGIKDNFGCSKWSESRYSPVYGGSPRCLEPVISWPCATCSQRMNMSCGIVGYVGGELVTAYLTGGALSMIKAGAKAGAASKIAQGIAKTKSFQTLAKGMSYAAKPIGATGKAMIGVLRFSAKSAVGIVKYGRKWALKIGGRFLPISNASKVKILRMMVKGKNLAKKPFSAYMNAMERAFAAGYHGADGVHYLIKARKLASTGRGTRAGTELIDYTTDSVKYNSLKDKLIRSNDDYNKLLLEYNNTLKRIRELGPDEAAKIAREQIRQLNKIKVDQTRLVTELTTEKKNIQAAIVAATNNVQDGGTVTLTGTRVSHVDDGVTPVVQSNRTTHVTSADNVVPAQVVDNVIPAGNVSDDIARTFQKGDHVDLYYKSGNNTKSAIIVGETDKQLIVRYAGEGPEVSHRINKTYLDMQKTFRYNNTGLVADDVIIPHKPTTDAISQTNRQGALGDVVRLKYKNTSNGMDGFVTGRIAKESDDTIWLVNASNPEPGRRIRKINLDLSRTRNFFDTRHLNATRNLQPQDAIAFTVKGEPISGEILRLNQKSIRIKDKLGNIKTYELRKIDLGSISSIAVDSATGVRIGASTTTGIEVLDDVGQTTVVTPALRARFTALNEQIKPLVGKAQEIAIDVRGKAQQVGRIMDQGTDFVVLRTSAGDKLIKYKDVLKVTIPGRLLLAFDGDKPVLTTLSTGPRVDNGDTVLPTGNRGYALSVSGTLEGDDVTCVAKVTKDGKEIDPDESKNEEKLKWAGHGDCLDKLECKGKLSQNFNNIDVLLEIPGKPEADWPKAKCMVSAPSPSDDVVVSPTGYALSVASSVAGNELSCAASVKKDGEDIALDQATGLKIQWKNQESKCGNSANCSGDMNLGFNNVLVVLQIDGQSPEQWPSMECKGTPAGDTWELIVDKSASTNDQLYCKFEVKKNGQALPLEEGMSIEFSDEERCKKEELSCTGALVDVQKFTATVKKEGMSDVSATCEGEKPAEPTEPKIKWELEVTHEFDKDKKEHTCKVKVKMDGKNISAGGMRDKGFDLAWEDNSDCKGKSSCVIKKDKDEFDSIDVKVIKKDDSEGNSLAKETCSDETSSDIYNDDDENNPDDQNGPRVQGPWHNYGPGTPIIPPQPMMLPPPMTYFHANFN